MRRRVAPRLEKRAVRRCHPRCHPGCHRPHGSGPRRQNDLQPATSAGQTTKNGGAETGATPIRSRQNGSTAHVPCGVAPVSASHLLTNVNSERSPDVDHSPRSDRPEPKDTLSLRLDCVLHDRLKQYCEFIQSPRDYVIGQALRQLFRASDRGVRGMDGVRGEAQRRLRPKSGLQSSPAPSLALGAGRGAPHATEESA